MSRYAKAYIGATILVGSAALAAALMTWRSEQLLRFVFYLGCALLCSPLKVRLPGIGSTLSVNYLFILIGVTSLSLAQTAVIACGCTLAQCLWKPKRKPSIVQLLFNVASAGIASTCSYVVYHAAWVGVAGDNLPARLFLGSSVYFLVNTLSIAGVVALVERKRLWKIWHQNFFWTAPQYLVGAALAGAIRNCETYVSWQWSLLILPAVYLIFRSYRLYLSRLDEEKRHVGEVAELHLRTIEGLAMAIDAKDQITHEHVQRVQTYATGVAKELGLTEEQVQALQAAALLHDIGKLAVPEYILSKPGRLTPEEFEKVKVHPQVGADIVEHMKFPYPVAPIVAAHHEKWDGTGYPRGLKGDGIPIGARILSVVDCLDALTSDRQYRPALSAEKAIETIVAASGTSYDPMVVDIVRRRFASWHAKSATPVQKPSTQRPAITCQAKPGAGFEDSRAHTEEPAQFVSSIAAAREEFQILHEVTTELGNSLSVQETLFLLGTRLRSVIPHDAIAIYVCKEDKLVPQYVDGQDFHLLSSLEIPVGEGLSGWVAENQKPIVNGNPGVEPGYQDDPTRCGLKSALSVPLAGLSGVVGVLTLYQAERNGFTKDHLRILLAVASKVGRTLENALDYQQAQESATTDELTGLPNSRTLFLQLDAELARSKRTGGPLAVLVADLDGFKQVNDRFGHLVGNRVLKLVGTGFRELSREYDYVARMGGDEFVIVLPGITPEALDTKIQQIVRMVERVGRSVGCDDGGFSCSVGTSLFPADGIDAEELLAEADKRMYAMKQLHHQRSAYARALHSSSREHPAQTLLVQ